MGLFQHKQATNDGSEDAKLFYNEYFGEELRNHARWYFEKIIDENAGAFKKDLDATITQVYADLKEHLTTTLDAQFAEYGKTMQQAQDTALESLNKSVQALQQQHEQLGVKLEKSIELQEADLTNVFDKTKGRIDTMNQTQDAAIQSLNASVAALQKQQSELAETLQENAAKQQELLAKAFEENMAQVVEHYLLGALGDQYDLKAQLPAIVKQLEENKQAIVDDMKL